MTTKKHLGPEEDRDLAWLHQKSDAEVGMRGQSYGDGHGDLTEAREPTAQQRRAACRQIAIRRVLRKLGTPEQNLLFTCYHDPNREVPRQALTDYGLPAARAMWAYERASSGRLDDATGKRILAAVWAAHRAWELYRDAADEQARREVKGLATERAVGIVADATVTGRPLLNRHDLEAEKLAAWLREHGLAE